MKRSKTKISTKLKKSLENGNLPKGFTYYDPTERLLDKELIAKAILECLRDNDPDGALEVLKIHIDALNVMRM